MQSDRQRNSHALLGKPGRCVIEKMAKPKPTNEIKDQSGAIPIVALDGNGEGPPSNPVQSSTEQLTAVDQLQAERAALEQELADAEKAVFEAEQYRASVTRALDEVVVQLQQSEGQHDNQHAIMAYIQRSIEERAKRVARRIELLELGADESEVTVTPRSPLDQAIAAKVRGKYPHRPQYRRPEAA